MGLLKTYLSGGMSKGSESKGSSEGPNEGSGEAPSKDTPMDRLKKTGKKLLKRSPKYSD